MNNAPHSRMSARTKIIATLGLALLAVVGNYLSVPLFFSVSFIFGSIAVMLAVALLGTASAVLVAIAGGLYTLASWGHPYALVTFTVEALAVGLLYRRGLRNLVLADLAYWLVLGVPLVLLFYRGAIGMEWEAVALIALKQPINGLFNALLAGLILLGLQLSWRGARRMGLEAVRLDGLLFHVLLTAILLAGVVPVIQAGYSQHAQQEAAMAERLHEQARHLAARLATEPDADPVRWQAQLAAEPENAGTGLALLATDGRVLVSEGEVASLSERPGLLQPLEGGLTIWLPAGDMPAMPRWKQGRYRVSVPVVGVAGAAAVVIEQAASPLVRTLERRGLDMFAFLAGLLVLGILVARLLSHWLIRPLSELDRTSRDMSTLIANGNSPVLPDSPIQEYDGLGRSLREMSGLLAGRFRELRDFNAALFGAAGAVMAVIDRNGHIVRFNRAAEAATGFSAGEIVGKPFWEFLLPPEEHARVMSVFANLKSGSIVPRYENHWLMRDGTRRLYDWSNAVLLDARGEAEFIVTVGVDITERRQAEIALREQALHTQAVLDNMVDGIITIDGAGVIGSFNPAAERIFGYTPAEVVGRNVRMLMPNPHRDAHDSYLRNYQATGVARIIGIGREVEGQRRDGSLFPMDLAISEVTRQGQPLYVGMVRDITERKRMERMKSEFVSTVSHELRTPLTSISGALGLVAGGALGALPEQAQQMIAIAQKNSQRLTHLINDLLDMEKIAAGKLHFEMRPQLLMPLIEQALDAIRPYGAERRVSLVLKDEAANAQVRVDQQRLMQVLANLLSNAIKFSPEDGTVVIAAQALAGKVRVAVADQGPGIPESFRANIFRKFAQADSSDTRQKGGTGLGLAISRELMERMGGQIGFDSVEGNGASFFFELPLWHDATTGVATASAPVVDVNAPRILVVEDEPDVAQLLGLMLTRAGYQVDIVDTGAEALHALQQTAYAAVSLDLMLPDISGLEIIRQVRQRPETAELPIVVVSAKMEEGRLALKGDFSGIDWLAKPIDENRLLSLVEGLVSTVDALYPRVLHVEDDADLHEVIRTMVGGRFDFELASTLSEARARVLLERFDVVILDLSLPDGSGWDLLPEIRQRQPETRVVILSGADMTADEARKVEAVLLKSQVSPRELLDALNTRIQSSKPKGART